MERRPVSRRIALVPIFVLIVFVPLLYSGGTILLYEALLLIWLVMLLPAYLIYASIRKRSSARTAGKYSAVVYVLSASFYSLATPVIAGKNLGLFGYLIIIPLAAIIMTPSLYLRYRTAHPATSQSYEKDSGLTRRLAELLPPENTDAPDVSIYEGSAGPNRKVYYTDGPNGVIRVSRDAFENFAPMELDAAMLKTYFEKKNNMAFKTLQKINIYFAVYVSMIVVLGNLSREFGTTTAGIAFLIMLAAVVIGFIPSVPLIISESAYRKDLKSDTFAAMAMKSPDGIKSYINRGIREWSPGRVATPARIERVRRRVEKMAGRRIRHLNGLEPGIA